MAGLRARPASSHKIGQHEADTAELFLEDVRVPDENVIGSSAEASPT